MTKFRAVDGLQGAALCERPPNIARLHLRGAPGRGIAFERAFGRYVREKFSARRAFVDQWIVYEDAHGRGYANADGWLMGNAQSIILWECKLTQQPEAFAQMRQKYLPLLEYLYPNHTISTLLVCKNLCEPIRYSAQIEDLFWTPRPGLDLTLHWRK